MQSIELTPSMQSIELTPSMQSIELTPSKFAQNSTITLINTFYARTGALFYPPIYEKTRFTIVNSSLILNPTRVRSPERHIYQQTNSLLLLHTL